VATHSGKKASIHLNAGPVVPRFRLQGPDAVGMVYDVDAGTSEEFSLLADVTVRTARASTLLSDVSVGVTNTAALDGDTEMVVTGRLSAAADMALAIRGQFGTFTDLAVIVTLAATTYADVLLVIVDASGGDDDYTFEGYGAVDGIRDPALEFLGKGLKFPFTFQRRSGGTQISTATSSDHAHIHESIRQILGTRRGERFLRPEFGSNLQSLIFESNDRILYGLIRHEVMTALDEWEPRVIVTDVLVGPREDEHLVLVNISYRLISSQVEGNLVYPFFRELK
jgi:uncharacterized protein